MDMEFYNKTTHKYILTFYRTLGWKEVFLKIIFPKFYTKGVLRSCRKFTGQICV